MKIREKIIKLLEDNKVNFYVNENDEILIDGIISFKSIEPTFKEMVSEERNTKIGIQILNRISEMNNTNEDVWTGNEVKQHLIEFIMELIEKSLLDKVMNREEWQKPLDDLSPTSKNY